MDSLAVALEMPQLIKEKTVNRAIENIDLDGDIFDILGAVSDNMLIFNAGFILGLNGRVPLILAGGTQMVGVLLIVNRILDYMGGEIDSSNLALAIQSGWLKMRIVIIGGLLDRKCWNFKIKIRLTYYSGF